MLDHSDGGVLPCRIDDESEFFTLAGSLLAAGTGSITFLSQQSKKKKSKKRRRSEAVATDATPATEAHAAIPSAARAEAPSDGLSAKARKKAEKQARRAAALGPPAGAPALASAPPGQGQTAMAPPSAARSLHNQEPAGKLNSLLLVELHHNEAPRTAACVCLAACFLSC